MAERERLPLWLPVVLGFGIGIYYAWPIEPRWWWSVLVMAVSVPAAWKIPKFGVRLVAVALAVAALGFSVAAWRTQQVAAPALYSVLYHRAVEGRIDDIHLREKGKRLALTDLSIERLSKKTTPARITVALRKDTPGLSIGDRIAVKATLFPPPKPVLPGGYDFARQFYYQRIGAVGFAPHAPAILEKAETRSFEEKLNTLRLQLNDRILAAMSPESGPVVAAMMVGEQSNVSEEVADAMRDAGIYHVLSISGLHMALAAALLYVSFRLLFALYPPAALRLPVKKIAAFLGLLGAFAYLLLAGYPVPAVRSFVMVACVMTAILFDRRGISLYSLAWAAMLILLWQPEALLGISFQLSFAATLGMLAFYERYSHLIYEPGQGLWRRLRIYFIGLMATSLVASLMTTPLVVYEFNRFSIWGIAANMLMMPLASFWIMPAAVLAFLAMPFGLEAWPLTWLDYGIGWMIEGARWFASMPYASVAVPPPTFWGLLLIVFGGLWLCLWRQRWRLLGIPALLIGLAAIGLHRPYDIMVSDDGSKVMWRRPDGEFLFLRGRPDSYDGEIWLRYHGKEEGLPLSKTEQPRCDRERCLLEIGGKQVAVALKKKTEGICDGGPDIVITAETLECPAVKLVIDRNYLKRNGITGIRFQAGAMEVDTAESHRGKRPWNRRPDWFGMPRKSPLYPGEKDAITER